MTRMEDWPVWARCVAGIVLTSPVTLIAGFLAFQYVSEPKASDCPGGRAPTDRELIVAALDGVSRRIRTDTPLETKQDIERYFDQNQNCCGVDRSYWSRLSFLDRLTTAKVIEINLNYPTGRGGISYYYWINYVNLCGETLDTIGTEGGPPKS